MTDWDRLSDYIMDYFPEPKYSRQDIRDWAMDNVPAWKYMKNRDKTQVLDDWENFVYEDQVEPVVESWLKRWSSGFIERVARFLGRLF